MKILISLIICTTVTAKPGILNDLFQLIKGPTGVEKSEYGKYPTEMYRREMGAQSDDPNNTQEKTDDQKSSQSPSLTSQFFKYILDGVDTLLDVMASKKKLGGNEEEDIDYTHLGIPEKVYWYYANKGVVPILGSGACSCPFQLQLYRGIGAGYNQKIPFNRDEQYRNSRGSARGPFLEPPGYMINSHPNYYT